MSRLNPDLERSDTEALRAHFSRLCEKSVADAKNFGIAFRLLRHGETLVDVYGGVQDPDDPVPVNGDTMFRLASMTKPVTSAAVLIAQEKGLLSLNDPVSLYLPAFAELWTGKNGTGPDGQPAFVRDRKCTKVLRIRHLISHTSGIGSGELGYYWQGQIDMKYRASLETIADYVPERFPLDFEPGERFAYSTTLGSDIAGRVVEIASGMPFDRFLKDNLFGPIGANDFTFSPDEGQWSRMVRMHSVDAQGRSVPDDSLGRTIFEHFPVTYFCGGAGLAGSLNSYTRFAEMLRQDGEIDGVRVMSQASARLLHTPWIAPGTPGLCDGETWGLQVRIVLGGHPYLPEGVYGWSGAYGTYFWIDPENDVTGIVMRNSRIDGCQDSVTANAFERAVYGAL